MNVSAKRVASYYRLAASITGVGARFMREAAAGAKPLIDAEGMASACEALGWDVTETVQGTVLEDKGVWECTKWLHKQVERAGTKVLDRGEDLGPDTVIVTTTTGARGPYRGSVGISRYTVAALDKDILKKIQRALGNLNSDKAGELGCTVAAEIKPQRERVRDRATRQVFERETGLWVLSVRVWLNLRVWSVANPKLKGTKKKPITLVQPNKGIKALDVKAIKAGKFWNSLYMRGLQQEATAYLEAEGADLPSEEQIETPEERIRRTFDQKVKKALLDFTAKQLKAVEEHFAAVYQSDVDQFLAYQKTIYDQWLKDWKAAGKPTPSHLTKFPPSGSPRYSWNRSKDVPPEIEQARRKGDTWKALAEKATRFLEIDKKRIEKLDLGYGTRVVLYKAPGNVRSQTEKAGKDTAAAIREAFIQKNTAKLSAIVTGKGNLDEITLRSWSKSSFEGELDVTFKDGSAFVVRNKTVYKVSSQGTWFAQFPTTFHYVKMPDGTRMQGTASERRMIQEFAGV